MKRNTNLNSIVIEGKDGTSGGLESADVWGDQADVSIKKKQIKIMK